MISCVICALNEERTIKKVLQVVKKVKDVDEIIVVSDGSTDKTNQIVSKIKDVNLIVHKECKGKGDAVLSGVKASKGDTILLCDADHTKLKPEQLQTLIDEYNKGKYPMVIGERYFKNARKHLQMFSGERILSKKIIMGLEKKIVGSRFGIEAILNQAVGGRKKYKLTPIGDTGHLIKPQKEGFAKSMVHFAYEIAEVGKAYIPKRNR
ncbi:glycosyltransferase family 2 protein [Patescibacteria group bacterium]